MATFKKYTDKNTHAMLWEWHRHVGTDINTGKRVVSSKKGFRLNKKPWKTLRSVNFFDERKLKIF